MTTKPVQPAFPLALCLALLSATALLVELGVLSALPAVFHRTGAVDRQAAMAAGLIAWGTAVLGVLPVAILGQRSVTAAAWGWVLGGTGRMAGALVLAVLAARVGGLPADVLLCTMAAIYLPLLLVEATMAGRYLWNKDSAGPGILNTNRGPQEN